MLRDLWQHFSISQSVFVYIYMSVSQSVYLSSCVRALVSLSVCMCLSVHVCPSVCLCAFVCLSVWLQTSLCLSSDSSRISQRQGSSGVRSLEACVFSQQGQQRAASWGVGTHDNAIEGDRSYYPPVLWELCHRRRNTCFFVALCLFLPIRKWLLGISFMTWNVRNSHTEFCSFLYEIRHEKGSIFMCDRLWYNLKTNKLIPSLGMQHGFSVNLQKHGPVFYFSSWWAAFWHSEILCKWPNL